MKIYTKTGDDGETSLIGGSRVKKFDPRLEAYGTVDELNSFIGLLNLEVGKIPMDEDVSSFLTLVQHQLFKIGSHLACEDPSWAEKLPVFDKSATEMAEKLIDKMDEELPQLKNFILPGGGSAASYAHVCRTICRRAERRIATVKDLNLKDMGVFLFLNRLSDVFFVIARYCNHKQQISDVVWDQNK